MLGRLVPIQAASTVWKTAAVGSSGPDFLNAAVMIETELAPEGLREQILRPIENLLGRIRTRDPNSPRTIDLDILVYDGEILEPDLWNYAHIGVPVAEILPDLTHPETGESVSYIAEQLITQSRIENTDLKLHWTSPTRNII